MNRTHILTQYCQRIDRDDRIKLTTAERSFLVQDFVSQLIEMDEPQAIEQLCRDEIALLEAGYGAGTNSTTNYLSKYRAAIAQAVESGKLLLTEKTTHRFVGHKQATGEAFEATNHLAWSLMRYDNSVYVTNRKATNVGNNERQDNPQPFVPDRYLEKVTELLQADEPETLAIGIAAVTGRRHTEVAVSGKFELTKHPYVLSFDGQLKKDTPLAYTIATLLPAQIVMQAIDRFRAMPQVQELQGRSSEEQSVKNFRARVNTRVKRHFQETEILPMLPGFQSVSVHRLRGAYARMIIYYWLPNQGANEQRFLQFYLGHVEAGEMKDATNSASTTHYFGYRLVDAAGSPITASGIKLMGNPPLPSPTDQQLQQQQQANDRLDPADLDLTTPDTEEDTVTPTLTTVETVAHLLADLPEKLPEPVRVEGTQFAIPTQRPARAKATKPRWRDVAVNVSDLAAVAEQLGLELPKNKGYQALLQQVLHTILVVETGRSSIQEDALTQAIAPLVQKINQLEVHLQKAQVGGEPLRLLSIEVENLRRQLEQVQAQRDHLQAQAEQVAALQAECDHLRLQFQHSQNLINQFRSIALRATDTTEKTTAPVTMTAPALAATQTPLADSPQPPTDRPLTPSASQHSHAGSKLSPDQRIALAITALIHHNESCTNPNDRWFISNQSIADMTQTNNHTKVKPWFEQHPETAEKVQQHNQQMETTNPHHNRGKDKEELRSIFQKFGEKHNA